MRCVTIGRSLKPASSTAFPVKDRRSQVKVEKILTLSFLLLVLVSIVNHQLTQKNASLIPTVQAQGTPTPTPTSTPTPTPTPTPGVGCTPGFWKNNAAKKNASQWTTYTPGELLSAAGFTTPIT